MNSTEPLRCHTVKVREALLEAREKTNDPMIRIETQSLAEEIGSFRSRSAQLSGMTFTVSKLFQSVNMQLDVAVGLTSKTKASLQPTRQLRPLQKCSVNVESVLKEKRR